MSITKLKLNTVGLVIAGMKKRLDFQTTLEDGRRRA